MKRISTPTRVIDKFGAGKPGFTNGNVVAGLAATDLESDWFDNVQEEICAVVEAKTGVTADGSSRTQMLDAIRWLIANATGSAGALSSRNRLINGAAQISSRAAPALSASAQYGAVDLIAGWASGGAITGGTLAQDTAAPVGRSGYACRFSGCTLTGAGQLSWRYRMEAADAVKLKNQVAMLRMAVRHDVGAAVNYSAILRKPNAADNFGATTVIATSNPVAVASATSTDLFPWPTGIALGDCSNGLELEIQIACGAIAAKNFWFAEWQLEEGTVATPFEFKSAAQEQRDVQRYVLVIAANVLTLSANAPSASAQSGIIQCDFPTEMRVAPSIPTISWALTQANTPAALSAGKRGLRFSVLSSAGGSVNANNSAPVVLSAEL